MVASYGLSVSDREFLESFVPKEMLQEGTHYGAYSSGSVLGCLTEDSGDQRVARIARYCTDKSLESDVGGLFNDTAIAANFSTQGLHKGKLIRGVGPVLEELSTGFSGAQLTGDCVSWGSRAAKDMTRVWREVAKIMTHTYGVSLQDAFATARKLVKRSATCLDYSLRGHTGEGAVCSIVSDKLVGLPLCLEQDYGTIAGINFNLTEYKNYYQLGMKHGRSGFPKEFIQALEKAHPGSGLKEWKLVTDPYASLDLMVVGKFPHIGSSMGFDNVGDPITREKGSWGHDMASTGFDAREDTIKRFGQIVVFIDQSWGKWNRVTGWLEDWGPREEGEFAILFDSFAKMVKARQCCHYSTVQGFVDNDDILQTSKWSPWFVK